MIKYATEAAENGAQIILFPEMVLTGCSKDPDAAKREDMMQVRLAEKIDGPSSRAMAKVASEKRVYIIYGAAEQIGDNKRDVYNSAIVSGPNGIIGSYKKV